MSRFFVSCREATGLSTELLEGTLSFSQRLRVRFHHLICAGCRRYLTQLESLRAAARKWGGQVEPAVPPGLDELTRRFRGE